MRCNQRDAGRPDRPPNQEATGAMRDRQRGSPCQRARMLASRRRARRPEEPRTPRGEKTHRASEVTGRGTSGVDRRARLANRTRHRRGNRVAVPGCASSRVRQLRRSVLRHRKLARAHWTQRRRHRLGVHHVRRRELVSADVDVAHGGCVAVGSQPGSITSRTSAFTHSRRCCSSCSSVRLSLPVVPSAAGAMLFALHPLRVESVAWIAERKDVLSGALSVLTLWLYVRTRIDLAEVASPRWRLRSRSRSWRRPWLSRCRSSCSSSTPGRWIGVERRHGRRSRGRRLRSS
jgi:hypothetical protein